MYSIKNKNKKGFGTQRASYGLSIYLGRFRHLGLNQILISPSEKCYPTEVGGHGTNAQ